MEGLYAGHVASRRSLVQIYKEPRINVGSRSHASMATEQDALSQQLFGSNQQAEIVASRQAVVQFAEIVHVHSAVLKSNHILDRSGPSHGVGFNDVVSVARCVVQQKRHRRLSNELFDEA